MLPGGLETGKAGSYKATAHLWFNFQYMRNFLVDNESAFVPSHPWMKDTPNSIRWVAVQEGIANYKAAMTNLQNGNITHFDAPFRQKKNKAWSLGFDSKQLRSNRIKVGDLEKVKTAESALLQD